jgi:hypothetical protein
MARLKRQASVTDKNLRKTILGNDHLEHRGTVENGVKTDLRKTVVRMGD